MCVFLFGSYIFYFVYSVFLCIVSPFVYSCLLPIFVQVYRPPPPDGNPIAIHKYHIIIHCVGQNLELYIKTQSVTRSKHSVSVIKTSQLMLHREIIAVCSQIHIKYIYTLCRQNVELYIKIQSVPRSKHTPSRLYKPVS